MQELKYKIKSIIYLIGVIEILIGLLTLSGLAYSFFFPQVRKPVNILVFVLISSLISASLGFGVIKLKDIARKLLIFFSGWVILTKILILIGILQFTGESIVKIFNPAFKDSLSILYHTAVILFFKSKKTIDIFSKNT